MHTSSTKTVKSVSDEPRTLYEAKQRLAELQRRIYGTDTWQRRLDADKSPPYAPGHYVRELLGSPSPSLPQIASPQELDPDWSPMKLKEILGSMGNRELKASLAAETGKNRKDKREALIAAIYREMKLRKL